ncbi:MAG: hypothetical protein L0Y74_10990 [candidate division Zixibacteria bacterium]|nr:hypothetical protein [candidate division Zixibacteria bacterium]
MPKTSKTTVSEQELARIDRLIESCARLSGNTELKADELEEAAKDLRTLLEIPWLFYDSTIPKGVYKILEQRLRGYPRQELEDLTTDVIGKLWMRFQITKNGPGYGEESASGRNIRLLRNWLTTVCLNTVTDIYRSKQPKGSDFEEFDEHKAEHGKSGWFNSYFPEAAYEIGIENLCKELPPHLEKFVRDEMEPTGASDEELSSKEKERRRRIIRQVKRHLRERKRPEA